MTRERWVVSGGTGLLGGALVASLEKDGHEVTVLSRGEPKIRGRVRTTFWTPTVPGGWQSSVEGADVVVHLAGAGIGDARWTDARLREIRDSRIRSGELIAEAIARADKKPRLYVSASAVGIYGAHEGGPTFEDTSTPGDDTLARICKDWERSADRAREAGVRVVHPRFGVILAKSGGALAKMIPPFRAFAGGPLGSGRQWMSWVHEADAVQAVRSFEGSRLDGGVNVTSPNPATMDTFAKALGEVLHRPSAVRAPALVIRAALGEMADIVLKGQRVLPVRLIEDGFKFRFTELQPALADVIAEEK